MSDDLVYRLRQERVDETAKRKHEWVGLTDDNKGVAIRLMEAGLYRIAIDYISEELECRNHAD
jgi:hypothetical protein